MPIPHDYFIQLKTAILSTQMEVSNRRQIWQHNNTSQVIKNGSIRLIQQQMSRQLFHSIQTILKPAGDAHLWIMVPKRLKISSLHRRKCFPQLAKTVQDMQIVPKQRLPIHYITLINYTLFRRQSALGRGPKGQSHAAAGASIFTGRHPSCCPTNSVKWMKLEFYMSH